MIDTLIIQCKAGLSVNELKQYIQQFRINPMEMTLDYRHYGFFSKETEQKLNWSTNFMGES